MNRFAAVLGLLAMMCSVAYADPLAEAHANKLQCYHPDTARKTCAALSGYVFESSGRITNNAEVLLSPQPLLVMRTTSPVVIKGEAVCGSVRQEDIETAQILLDGAVLAEDKAAGVRAQILSAYQGQVGKEVCTTYVSSGDRLSAQVTVDGVPSPAFTQEVIWVMADDGYRVSP